VKTIRLLVERTMRIPFTNLYVMLWVYKPEASNE
jgi:hypothetical protein